MRAPSLSPSRTPVQQERLSPASLSVWYFALLVPTLAFKLLFLRTMAGGDLQMIATLATSAQTSLWRAYAVHLLPADGADAATLLVVFAAIALVLRRVPPRWIAAASVLLLLLAGGVNAASLSQIEALVSRDTLVQGWHWTSQHPDLIWQVLTPRRIAGVIGAVLAAAVPIWLMPRARTSRSRLVTVGLPMIAAAIATYSVVLSPFRLRDLTTPPTLATGFWRATAQALVGPVTTRTTSTSTLTAEAIVNGYRRLVYPTGVPSSSDLVTVPSDRRIPRHVVLITLETAPLAYYKLADDPALPTFRAMSQHAIVGDRHYANAPMTRLAVASLLSGVYPPSGSPEMQAGGFSTNGLGQVLAAHGYETSFLDPYDIDWDGPAERQAVRDLGFARIENGMFFGAPEPNRTETVRRRDERAFEAAFDAIAEADDHHHKAFVTLISHLGHYSWATPDERLSSRERVAWIARQLDGFMGALLGKLEARGLKDDVLVVVVGDHGLRVDMEFASLGEPARYGDLTFHVPLLIYAPALFPQPIRVPFVTSHVDVAPTVLGLLGIAPSPGDLLLGENVLDRRLADRLTFQLSGAYPGLHPVDSFLWHDETFSYYRVLDRATVRPAGDATEHAIEPGQPLPFGAATVQSVIDTATRLFDDAGEYFRRRRTTGQ